MAGLEINWKSHLQSRVSSFWTHLQNDTIHYISFAVLTNFDHFQRQLSSFMGGFPEKANLQAWINATRIL